MSQEVSPTLSRALARVYGRAVDGTLTPLAMQASGRRYLRFRPAEAASTRREPSRIAVMCLPDAPDLRDAGLAQARAFVDVQRHLAELGVRVPKIYLVDLDAGFLLLEDLGDETFEARLRTQARADWHVSYAYAIARLAELHPRAAPPKPPEACIAYRRRFDAALLRSELEHFAEWGLLPWIDASSADLTARLFAIFDALMARLVALPVGFVHRDYQSRNLMWLPAAEREEQGAREDELVVLDFQDAFIGPAHYDLVALLCDSYVDIEPRLASAMLDRYAAQRGYPEDARKALHRDFALLAVQRKLKDAGRFVFIDRVRGNPSFLRHYPSSLVYVAQALDALAELPEIGPLRALLTEVVPGFPCAVSVPAAVSGT